MRLPAGLQSHAEQHSKPTGKNIQLPKDGQHGMSSIHIHMIVCVCTVYVIQYCLVHIRSTHWPQWYEVGAKDGVESGVLGM